MEKAKLLLRDYEDLPLKSRIESAYLALDRVLHDPRLFRKIAGSVARHKRSIRNYNRSYKRKQRRLEKLNESLD